MKFTTSPIIEQLSLAELRELDLNGLNAVERVQAKKRIKVLEIEKTDVENEERISREKNSWFLAKIGLIAAVLSLIISLVS